MGSSYEGEINPEISAMSLINTFHYQNLFLVSVQDKDDFCFKWCVIRYLYPKNQKELQTKEIKQISIFLVLIFHLP